MKNLSILYNYVFQISHFKNQFKEILASTNTMKHAVLLETKKCLMPLSCSLWCCLELFYFINIYKY